MSATRAKYFFRKKMQNGNTEGHQTTGSSSTDSDEISRKVEESRLISLHLITNPGQSSAIRSSFQQIVAKLDPNLHVICVSERFKALKPKEITPDVTCPVVPALGVVLFFKDEFSFEHKDQFSEGPESPSVGNPKSAMQEQDCGSAVVREIFSRKPWRFHHKVAVSGKLISCAGNQQDYYEYVHQETISPRNGRKTPNAIQYSVCENSHSTTAPQFPLWGVRKVHYGKQVLRFTLFASNESWEDQLNLYKLILRRDERKIRDDFCYFEIFSNANTCIQLGLKKLPKGLTPQPLSSSILQFKVKNVGQLVPLLPHSCDPISELRWRTRDHDSNLILLQIQRSRGLPAGSSFVKKVFSDHESSDNRDKSKISLKHAAPVICPTRDKLTIEMQELKMEGSSPVSDHEDVFRMKAKLLNDIREMNEDVGDSFVCPSLPEKMPLLKPTIYFQPTGYCSLSSASSSSSIGCHSAGTSSPKVKHHAKTAISSSSSKSSVIRWRNPSTPKPEISPASYKRVTPDLTAFNSAEEEGFYV